MKQKRSKVSSRNDPFVNKTSTRIWQEAACEDNPFVSESAFCHGYPLLDLVEKRSFVDTVYLLLRGELPGKADSVLFEKLMIGLINPGPRHPATRAAMIAGVGKTDISNILPIALTLLGGEDQGTAAVEPAMRFIRKHLRHDPKETAHHCIASLRQEETGEKYVAPGFGSIYGSTDIQTAKLASVLCREPSAGKALKWCVEFVESLQESHCGWLPVGLAAAVFSDLGFQPRMGAGVLQMICAPGLFAHGIELANKPVTAMPFISDDQYEITHVPPKMGGS